MNWKDVKDYLKTYVGKFYETAESKEVIYIGSDLPDEYTGSNYTYKLKGTVAKANATQGIKGMIEIATNKKARANDKENIKRMQNLGGINMIQGLLFQCMTETNLSDTMFLMLLLSSDMMRIAKDIFMIL